jgi:hypothetical protein
LDFFGVEERIEIFVGGLVLLVGRASVDVIDRARMVLNKLGMMK